MTQDLQPKFKVYRDFDGKFKWSLRNPRNEPIAESPFGFLQKKNCVQDALRVKEMMSRAQHVEFEGA